MESLAGLENVSVCAEWKIRADGCGGARLKGTSDLSGGTCT